MADVSELAKLTPAELEKIQAVISLFHLLGLTDEDISILPEVLKNWRKAVDTINAHTEDLVAIKRSISLGKADKGKASMNGADEMQMMVGFGMAKEKIFFDNGAKEKQGKEGDEE